MLNACWFANTQCAVENGISELRKREFCAHTRTRARIHACKLTYPQWHACAGYLDICKNVEWWRKLKAVHRLLEPFKVAIHTLEADQALLSQVWKVTKFVCKF